MENQKVLMELDSGMETGLNTPKTDREMRLLQTYKKIVCLHHIDRCGMCGTTRHITKPYWHVGMRLCKHCLQDNLISETVLEERFFIRVFTPVPLKDGLCFSQIVAGKVWYFKEHCASRQRTEYSSDVLDIHPALGKSPRTTWLFWLPHLEQYLDMHRIREEAVDKRAAAGLIRAHARRALTLRILGTKSSCTVRERIKRPTYSVEWEGRQQALRAALFTLRRMLAHQECKRLPCLPRWNTACIHRISDYEDRLLDTGHP